MAEWRRKERESHVTVNVRLSGQRASEGNRAGTLGREGRLTYASVAVPNVRWEFLKVKWQLRCPSRSLTPTP